MARLLIVSNRLPPRLPQDQAESAQRAPVVTLILDYDGTLTPIVATPDLAIPDPDLYALLQALSARPGVDLHIASGRTYEDLERWFGSLPIGLHAEHGFWSRLSGAAGWTPLEPGPVAWKAEVRAILHDVSRRTAGSFVEEKTASLAWHYRMVEPKLARAQIRELYEALAVLAETFDLDLLAGAKALEVRLRKVNKGLVARGIEGAMPAGTSVVAIGDDRTDEDLFAALAATALTIHVGRGPSRARYRLDNPTEVRRFLRGFVP